MSNSSPRYLRASASDSRRYGAMPPGGSKLWSSTSTPSSARSAPTWSRTNGPSAGRRSVGHMFVTTSTRTGGNLSAGSAGGHEHQVVVERVERLVAGAAIRRAARLVALERGDQLALHAEHGIFVEVFVALHEHVGDERLEALGLHLEVHVRRAHRAAPARLEQLSDRPVRGDRIGLRQHRPEPEAALPVRAQLPAPARLLEVGVLDVVEAVLVRLPHVDSRARNRAPVGGEHASAHEAWASGRATADVVAVLELRRALYEEGAEHRGLRGLRRLAVVDPDHEHGDAEHVREQDELLALVVGD